MTLKDYVIRTIMDNVTGAYVFMSYEKLEALSEKELGEILESGVAALKESKVIETIIEKIREVPVRRYDQPPFLPGLWGGSIAGLPYSNPNMTTAWL